MVDLLNVWSHIPKVGCASSKKTKIIPVFDVLCPRFEPLLLLKTLLQKTGIGYTVSTDKKLSSIAHIWSRDPAVWMQI